MLFWGCMLQAQQDSLRFMLQDEFEYTGTFSAYSGVFDQLNREYLYVATKELGLIIYETDSCSLRAIDTLANTSFSNLKVSNLYQDSIYLYLALGDFQAAFGSDVGLAILNVANPRNPIISSFWKTNNYRNGAAIVKVVGDYAYMGIMDEGLLILDVSDKAAIQFVSQIQPDPNFPSVPGLFTVPHARGLDIKGDYAYVSYDAGGLRIVDISDKANPVEVGMYVNQYINDSAGRAYNHVWVENGYAYNAVDYCGFEVVDVRDPANPTFVSHLNLWDCDFSNWEGSDGHANELIKLEDEPIILAASGESELIALDVSNPTELIPIGNFGGKLDSAATWGMAQRGNKLALFYLDNSGIPPGFPQPFYADFGGIRLLEMVNTATGYDNKLRESRLGLKVYPNPFSHSIKISLAEGNKMDRLRLLNYQGMVVYEKNPDAASFELDFVAQNLSGGTYFLQIFSNQFFITKTLLKIGF